MSRRINDIWHVDDLQKLMHLVATEPRHGRGHRIPWYEIGRTLGRTAMACRTKHRNQIDKERKQSLRQKANLAAKPNPPQPKAIILRPICIDTTRATSTAQLRTAAELLIRIGHPHGIAAGMLGDPPPGRSALDRKRREAATP